MLRVNEVACSTKARRMTGASNPISGKPLLATLLMSIEH